MVIYNVFHGFWYKNVSVKKTEIFFNELKDFLVNKAYTTVLQLDEIHLVFLNSEAMKCRIRPYYEAARDMEKDDPWGP